MPSKKEVTLGIRLIGINLIEEKLDIKPALVDEIRAFNFSLSAKHVTDNEKNIVTVSTEVTISPNESNIVMGYMKVDCSYEVENLKALINKKTGKVKFPEGFTKVINSISLSTLRGIMFSRFKGTILGGAILPIMDPIKLDSPELVAS